MAVAEKTWMVAEVHGIALVESLEKLDPTSFVKTRALLQERISALLQEPETHCQEATEFVPVPTLDSSCRYGIRMHHCDVNVWNVEQSERMLSISYPVFVIRTLADREHIAIYRLFQGQPIWPALETDSSNTVLKFLLAWSKRNEQFPDFGPIESSDRLGRPFDLSTVAAEEMANLCPIHLRSRRWESSIDYTIMQAM